MNIVIATGRLQPGIDEDTMLAASERFQHELVAHEEGVLRRILVAGEGGHYADIVLFADEAAIGRVMAAEAGSEAAQAFMAMWDGDAPGMYRVLQLHE